MATWDVTASAYAFRGNYVGADVGFAGPTVLTNTIASQTTGISFERFSPGTALTVSTASNVDLSIGGGLYATGLTSTTGTALILGAGNRVFLLTSSARFKEDINYLDVSGTLRKNYLELKPVTYRYKAEDVEAEKPRLAIGLIAEEVEKLFPEAVNFDAENLPFSISYDQISTITVGVVQTLIKEFEELKARVKLLDGGI